MEKNNIISDWLDQYGNPEIDKFVETQLNQNNMTAVEWLEEELKANLKKVILEGDSELMKSLFEQAKEMEKEQMCNHISFGAGLKKSMEEIIYENIKKEFEELVKQGKLKDYRNYKSE